MKLSILMNKLVNLNFSFLSCFLRFRFACIFSLRNEESVLPLSIQCLYFSLHSVSKTLTLGEAFHVGPFSLVILQGTAASVVLCKLAVNRLKRAFTDRSDDLR